MKKQYRLYQGDNLESLKKLPDNSIDSIVTDGPYGLKFMSRRWDYNVPSVEFWKEVYRVLKPGGHVLSFGGTRTYHRMVVNIEDAGFEIRDQIMWIYSTGFPKSLNVKKQFVKNGYKICECTEQNTKHDLRPLSETNISQTINIESEQGQALLSQLSQQDIQISKHSTSDVWREEPSVEGWNNSIQKEGQLQGNNIQESTRTSERNGEEGWIYNGAQNDNGSNDEQIINKNGSGSSHRPQSEQQSYKQSGTMADKRRPQESGSRKICGRCGEQIIPGLDNLGTSLKPANEPICVARKPLSEKSVAENVLKWGTGGINIDGCRIGTDILTHNGCGRSNIGAIGGAFNKGTNKDIEFSSEGRFPANIIFDESAAEMLDEQSGISKSASRFFYIPKVSKKERNMSCKCSHPTLKPVQLMAYLCRLVTPPNGIVLDPFMGSGSTGISALLEGFRFCGMELSEEYFKIAEARIENYELYREFVDKKKKK